ncbi:MAG: hypothetical protein Q7T76_18760 [Ferruginibacter sp.]|nr:hypothetical protein [Ferruginibacter sp.]
MSHHFLFPHKLKLLGWVILVPSIVAGLYLTITDADPSWLNAKMLSLFPSKLYGTKQAFSIISVNLAGTLAGVGCIIGGVLVGFSKEKQEDEFIASTRLSSLLWAVFVNYGLLLIAFIFVYETAFLSVMVYNMFTVLLLFIIRFNYLLFQSTKTASDEK